MVDIHVVRVFTDSDGNFGNPLGIVLETGDLDDARRQAIARELNFSETVFVEDVVRAELRIFTPAQELPLAGHPLVGTAWLLRQATGKEVSTLRPLLASGDVQCRTDFHGLTWIRARIEDAPPWRLVQLPTPDAVDELSSDPGLHAEASLFWAWQEEASGQVRARFFAPSYGVPEDEATGSAALRLVGQLERSIVIHQGRGSLIHARPASDAAYGEVGGLVAKDEVRTI